MILQQLWQDADAIMAQTGRGPLPPSMYMPKRVKWIVELSLDTCQPIRFTPTPGSDQRGLERLVPFLRRTVSVVPLLLADKASYTFGVRLAGTTKDAGRDLKKDQARTLREHHAYKELLRLCAAATNDRAVACIAAFLDAWNPHDPAPPLPESLGRDDLITFQVDGVLPIETAAVQRFWARAAADEGAGEVEAELEVRQSSVMQCLVSGETGLVVEKMPVPVKGLLGGKLEMVIVSANAHPYESYGLIRARTSPISRAAAERFGQALNALLASDSHCHTVGRLTYVFWTRSGIVPVLAFHPPSGADELTTLLTAQLGGLPPEDEFHIYGLTANVARVVVRSALDITLGEIAARQAAWFARLSLLGPDGAPGRPLSLKALAIAAYREFKDIAPSLEDALVQAALAGTPLPESLLRVLVMRCRLDTNSHVTYPRAALLKYLLTQTLPLAAANTLTQESTPQTVTAAVVLGTGAPAYHCGRLFAQLENIQQEAIAGRSAGISSRFFGAAATAPASIFRQLLAGARGHLVQIDPRLGGRRAAERRLETIRADVGAFPTMLPLRDQALFCLGYYHHRAAQQAAIVERIAAKRQSLAGDVAGDFQPETLGGDSPGPRKKETCEA